MSRYLSSFINCASLAEALERAKAMRGHVVVQEHKDGTASINILQDKPVQPGQVEFKQ